MENTSLENQPSICEVEAREVDSLISENDLNFNQEKNQEDNSLNEDNNLTIEKYGILSASGNQCGESLSSNADKEGLSVTHQIYKKEKQPSHVSFNMPPLVDSDTSSVKERKSNVHQNTSIYVARASTMRSKIEEKISEIERKINLSSLDSSSESIDADPSPADYNLIKVLDSRRSRSCSVSEMRQNTIDRLQSKLEKAEKDLELREEEVFRLRKIRDEVGSEIEDLTASLFEEANNMVKNAYIKQQKSDKRTREANMKLTMLQEEVTALKTILQSNKMCSCTVDNQEMSEKGAFIPPREIYEVDPVFHDEFVKWRQTPNLDKDTLFMKRIYEEDIKACLNFKNSELSKQVLSAIEGDKITIEKIPVTKHEPLPKLCALLDAPRLCTYKMCLDGKNCYNISTLSRNRITAICDLFCYFRYIQKGLITLRIHEVYLEVLKKRRRITSAKLGLIDDVLE